MRRLRLPLGCLLALFSLVAARDARADDVSDLLDQGVALRREHRNEEALAVFERAFELSPVPRTRAQVALAEQALGRWLDADRDLTSVLAEVSDPWISRNLEALRGAQGVVLQHLGWLAVDVGDTDAEILLDGKPLTRGIEARVVASSAVLEVRAPGRVPDIRRVELGPTVHEHIAITLVPLVPLAPSPVAVAPLAAPSALDAPRVPGPESPSSTSTGPWLLGAAGLVAVGTGTYFGIRTFADKSSRDAQCAQGCQPAALTYDSDARTSASISTVSFALGGALVAAGGVWWWLDRRATSSHAARIEVSPIVGACTGGVLLWGKM
jgi:hypothetical protein